MIYSLGKLKSNSVTSRVSINKGCGLLILNNNIVVVPHGSIYCRICLLEALELLRNPPPESGLTQAIVDAIFSRKTSDIDEFTYDTDTAAKVNNIGSDKRAPTPSEGLIRGE